MADDKDNKFILGDNSDGYRRASTGGEFDFSLFEERKPKQPAPQPAAPKGKRQQRKPAPKPATPKKPAPAKQQRPPAARPQKGGARQSQNTNPAQRRTSSPARPSGSQQRRPRPQQPNQRELSQNERIKQHSSMRRVEQKRKQILSYLAIGVAVVAVVAVLSLTLFFQINEISVKGESPYPAEQVVAACGLDLGENVIRCDAKGVSEKLAKALPYIESATVKRSLSGKIVITVKQTQGKYSIIFGGQCVVINAEGKVLEIAAAEEAIKYTVVVGTVVGNPVPGTPVEFTDPQALSYIMSLGNALDAAGISPVTSLNITDKAKPQAVYEGRITLLIGSTDKLERKLALAAKTIESVNNQDPTRYGKIDLTIESRAYYTPEEDIGDEPETGETEENVSQAETSLE